MINSVTAMVLQDVGEDAERWAGLVQHVSELPAATRSELIRVLEQVANSEPEEAFKSRVWPELEQMVAWHRQLNEANWALPETYLASFHLLLERLQPAEPVIVYRDLFSSRHLGTSTA